MKRFVLLLAFIAAPAFADGSTTALCTAKSSPGACSSIYSATVGTGGETWSFLKSGDGSAQLQISLDAGSTWVAFRPFTPGQGGNLITAPSCGGCRWRVYVTSASSTSTVTVGATVSGVLVPTVVAP